MAKELSSLIERKIKGIHVCERDVTYRVTGVTYSNNGYILEIRDPNGKTRILRDMRFANLASPYQIKKYRSEERENLLEVMGW